MDAELSKRVLESGYGVNELIEIGLAVTSLCQKNGPGDYLLSELQAIRHDVGSKSHAEHAQKEHVLSELHNIKQMMGASAKKGAVAENAIMSTIVKNFPNYEVENMAHKAGMCDLLVSDGSMRIAIEIKNYETNVPSSEVKKLERDLMSMDVSSAIMISCKSGIALVNEQFAYKMVGNKLAVFLSNGGNDGLSVVWAVLFIKSSLSIIKKLATESDHSTGLVLRYVESKLETIRECIADNNATRDSLARMKAAMMRSMDNAMEDILHTLNLNKSRLQHLVESFSEFISTEKAPISIGLAVEPKEDKRQTLADLRKKAKEMGIDTKKLKKQQIIDAMQPVVSHPE